MRFFTLIHGMWVTLRYWLKTYDSERKTFTEHFEYPELPLAVAPRYRGFHRFDLLHALHAISVPKRNQSIASTLGKRKSLGGKGFKITALCYRLFEVHVLCALVSSLVRLIVSSWARSTI